jgi:hypothetical protein
MRTDHNDSVRKSVKEPSYREVGVKLYKKREKHYEKVKSDQVAMAKIGNIDYITK